MSGTNPLKKLIGKAVSAAASAVSQTSVDLKNGEFEPSDGIKEICRKAAAEGIVLLKNDLCVFPILPDETVSVFGRVQTDTFFVGYGSGGDVNAYYKTDFLDALENDRDITLNNSLADTYKKWSKKNKVDNGYWGHWPMCYDEMPLTEDIVKNAAASSKKAIVIIGRAAGEDRENTLTRGSFYLTDEEENMLALVSASFEKYAVILNIGGIFDFSWCEKYDVPAVMITWHGGMESGNAFTDVVSGRVNPSGCLPDSIARNYDDYPSSSDFGGKNMNTYKEDIYVGYRYFETFDTSAVLFPFGTGLSYTEFSTECISFAENSGTVNIKIRVTNIGLCNGKKVIHIYHSAPQGKLGKPAKVLSAFGKSRDLSPGENEVLSFSVSPYEMASYDDTGYTGNKSCYVLEKGVYEFMLGGSVRDASVIGSIELKETTVIEKLSEASAVEPENAFMRIRPYSVNGSLKRTLELVPVRTVDLAKRIEDEIPTSIFPRVGHGYKFEDVGTGEITLNDFISELTYDELEALTRGDYVMNSSLGPKGNAGVFGGVTESLREKGVSPVVCTDGPSGIRLAAISALLPSGTALASSRNCELIRELYSFIGIEMKERGTHVLLAPGMNIHRDPLCGRNFEYFSEDPLLTGKIAAAVVQGIQSKGVSSCVKHFACNNQETNRTHNNSVVSERALREIYLKGFEICIKTAEPKNVMTSYNKINGVWAHYNYDLVTTILRGEWGYRGNVMTDWWMRSSVSPEFPVIRDQAYRVRAGVDVLMPGGAKNGKRAPDGTLFESLGKKGGITTGEMQRAAYHVLSFVLDIFSEEE